MCHSAHGAGAEWHIFSRGAEEQCPPRETPSGSDWHEPNGGGILPAGGIRQWM